MSGAYHFRVRVTCPYEILWWAVWYPRSPYVNQKGTRI